MNLFTSLLCLSAFVGLSLASPTAVRPAAGKVISPFQVIDFPNEPCDSDNAAINGTCMTSQECDDKDGKKSGNCADGFGVCCVFSLECGESSSNNNTQLTKSTSGSGLDDDDSPCYYEICPVNDNICRIKLDFKTFNIQGPFVGTAQASGTVPVAPLSAIGDCNMDSFSVTAPGGTAPPVICGENSGQHMIIDAAQMPRCHMVVFSLAKTSPTRNWDIHVTQHECSEQEDIAGPPGCLQYFTSSTGTLQSFNFPSGNPNAQTTHLSSQMVTHCIRANKDMCQICYKPTIQTGTIATFGISNGDSATAAQGSVDNTQCASDYLQIPGAATGIINANAALGLVSKICGRFFSTTSGATAGVEVCTRTKPFRVTFASDADEIFGGREVNNMVPFDPAATETAGLPGGIVGYKLDYRQIAC